MTVYTGSFTVQSNGFTDIIDISREIESEVSHSGISAGTALVFAPGSTAGITSIEFEAGAVADFKAALDRLIPQEIDYDHDARWGDGNGFSHVRAAMLGASFTVPFSEGHLMLGTWQQVVLVDFDNKPRQRKVIVQVQGE